MDYTHEEVRDWVFAMLQEILRRFDVDGFEFNDIRWMHTFPQATARESHAIMTKFIRRARARIDAEGARRGRKLMLGVRVPQTLEECTALGYDVATWIREGLVDYVAPCDFFHTDFNAASSSSPLSPGEPGACSTPPCTRCPAGGPTRS